MPFQDVDERAIPGSSLQPVPDRDRCSPTWAEHAPHLDQRLRLVLEEHQTELAQSRVEGLVLERQVLSAAFCPVQIALFTPGDREHVGIAIQARYRALRSNPYPRRCRHRAAPAGHVEHPVASVQARGVDQACGPWSAQHRSEEPVEVLGHGLCAVVGLVLELSHE
jgi:hypothetical protein